MNRIWLGGRSQVATFCCGVFAMVLSGCGGSTLMPKLNLLPETLPQQFDDSAWAAVLRENVKDGLVDYNHLSQHRTALDRFAALLSVMGPASTPDRFTSTAAKTAYWINAFNAMTLNAVLEAYPIETMYDLVLPRLEHDYRFVVDGRTRALGDIEKRLREIESVNPYAWLALCRAAYGSPPLADEPYRAENLDAQLARQVRRIVESDRYVRVDHEQMKLLVSLDILAAQNDLVEHHRRRTGSNATTLLHALQATAPSPGRRRQLGDAVGYRVGTIPFDRRLNHWGTLPPRTDTDAPRTASTLLP